MHRHGQRQEILPFPLTAPCRYADFKEARQDCRRPLADFLVRHQSRSSMTAERPYRIKAQR
jgi:hypothetical protein